MKSDKIIKEIEQMYQLPEGTLAKQAMDDFGDMDDFVREIRICILVSFVFFKYCYYILDSDKSHDEMLQEFNRMKEEYYFIHMQLHDKNYDKTVELFADYINKDDFDGLEEKLQELEQYTMNEQIGPLTQILAKQYEQAEFDKETYLGIVECFPDLLDCGNADMVNEIIDAMFEIYIPEELLQLSLEYAGFCVVRVKPMADMTKEKIMAIVENM